VHGTQIPHGSVAINSMRRCRVELCTGFNLDALIIRAYTHKPHKRSGIAVQLPPVTAP